MKKDDVITKMKLNQKELVAKKERSKQILEETRYEEQTISYQMALDSGYFRWAAGILVDKENSKVRELFGHDEESEIRLEQKFNPNSNAIYIDGTPYTLQQFADVLGYDIEVYKYNAEIHEMKKWQRYDLTAYRKIPKGALKFNFQF
jgi:hypothetical protein